MPHLSVIKPVVRSVECGQVKNIAMKVNSIACYQRVIKTVVISTSHTQSVEFTAGFITAIGDWMA